MTYPAPIAKTARPLPKSDRTPEERAALSRLRHRCFTRDRGESMCKLTHSGIYLVIRFRGEPDARTFADDVKALGGHVAECRKTGKAKHTGDLTWRVVFSVSSDVDQYLEGRITMDQLEEWRSWDLQRAASTAATEEAR